MAGLLSGLAKLGLKNLEDMALFEESAKEEKASQVKELEKKEPTIPQEKEYLYDKTYECPVCDKTFVQKTVRSGKVKLNRTDRDLRPVYDNIEPLKYEAIVCPHCGYAAHSRYFSTITSTQKKAVQAAISQLYHKTDAADIDIYTYTEAVEKYKLCLANAIVKKAKSSEKAYICLKAGWLMRSMRENFDKAQKEDQLAAVQVAGQLSPEQVAAKKAELKAQEDEFLENALTGLLNARQTESYPICGMDEITVEYLLAALALHNNQFDLCSRMVSGILGSSTANSRIKEKTRDIKEALMAKMKEKA